MRGRWLWRGLGVALAIAGARWAWTAADDAGWFDAKAVPVADEVARAMLRDVNRWDAASSGERRGVAERVAAMLDAERAGFALVRVRSFGAGDDRHEIAVFGHDTTGLEFSLIPGGTFVMGSPATEGGRDDDETQHEVTLTRALLLARTECTQAAWERVAGTNPSTYRGPDLPVETVSWDDARVFCAKAGLRLPTEAEWESACRAGTTTPFWSGDAEEDLARAAWTRESFVAKTRWWRRWFPRVGPPPPAPVSQPVGTLAANPYGLHDVHGNVWEWCEDAWDRYPTGAVTDPTGPAVRVYPVFRGGSWVYARQDARSAFRLWTDRDRRIDNVGFRPARSVPP